MINLKNSGQGNVILFQPLKQVPIGYYIKMRHKRNPAKWVEIYAPTAAAALDSELYYMNLGYVRCEAE